ncbi:hypothetical protein J3T78_12825, partial [Staphylococcus nepalensis]|nr:hypothetical protein [Staphylococcus nepalensis]
MKRHKTLVFIIFLLMAAMVWMLINYLKNEQTTNLSCLTINQNKVNSQIDIRNYIKNDDVMLKKYQ